MNKPQKFEQWITETAAVMRDDPVPNWSRESTFRARNQYSQAWWQRPWLPLSSLAVSAFALVLVLGQVQITSNAYGFSVQFGGADQAQLEALVTQRLNEYGAEQQLFLANYAHTLRSDVRADFRVEMAQANQQLADYMLAVNRQERESDLVDLIRYVNEQREDDQYFFASQLQQFSDGWIEQVGFTTE